MYMRIRIVHVRFVQIKERVAAALCYLLLAKAATSAVSVVKADHVQGGATTNRVQRKISISVAALNGPLW